MHVELPILWIIFLNVVGWLAIQLGLAWLFTKMPARWFPPPGIPSWEHNGNIYQRVFRIKKWKKHLPDGASWFNGGFTKQKLSSSEQAYIRRFMQETWRGEICHWTALACTPLFLTWNPLGGDCVVIVYAIASNVPCVFVQRYNRARLSRIIAVGNHDHTPASR